MKIYRSERQQGKFPKYRRVSVVVCCKIQRERVIRICQSRSLGRGACDPLLQEMLRAACDHTRVLLLSMVRMQVLAAVPLLFTALHMYSPSSSGKVSGRYRQYVSPLSMY